jgi:hypothetical protein
MISMQFPQCSKNSNTETIQEVEIEAVLGIRVIRRNVLLQNAPVDDGDFSRIKFSSIEAKINRDSS